MDTPEPRSPRRFLRLSLRGLMLLVLVIAAPLGWIVHRAHIQRDAVAAIVRAGGTVRYDPQYKNGKPVNAPLRTPGWMAAWVGVDYLDTVTMAACRQKTVDLALARVGELSRLETLFLASTPVTDAGVDRLKQAIPGLLVRR